MRIRNVLLGIACSVLFTITLVGFGIGTPAGADTLSPHAPDITLTPGESPQFKEYQSLMIGDNRTDPPDQCRNSPAFGVACDAYRLKLNLSKKPGAQNFVVVELDWENTQVPTIVLPVGGESLAAQPNMDLLVYKTATVQFSPAEVGGGVIYSPERVAFVALQPEYDLVVKVATGAVQRYTLRAYMTDELFGKPFESLDEVLKHAEEVMPAPEFHDDFSGAGGFEAPADLSDGIVGLPPLPEASVSTDSQIRGLNPGINEQFGPGQFSLGKGQSRDVVAVGQKPSGIALVLGLVIVPIAAAAGGTFWLRRRRQALI